jgi:hypothetical protein
MSSIHNQFEKVSMQIADLSLARRQASLELLGCMVPLGRYGVGLASRNGITEETFEGDLDAKLIFITTKWSADNGRVAMDQRAKDLRTALRVAECFDERETRSYVAGMKWGVEAVACLLTRVPKIVAEEELPELAHALLEIISEVERFIGRAA